MKYLREKLIVLIIGLTSLGFTIFILLNSWEVYSNRDLPYVNSINRLESQEAVDSLIMLTNEEGGIKNFEIDTPSMGELDYMYFPATDDRIFIGKERFNNGWLYRPNNIHYYVLNYDESGLEGDYLFYSVKNWRTIPRPDLVVVGDEVQVVNQYGRGRSFVIYEKKVLEYGSKFVPDTSGLRQLVILVEDQQNDVYYTYLAR